MTNPKLLKRQDHIKLEEMTSEALYELDDKNLQSPGIFDEHMVDLARINYSRNASEGLKILLKSFDDPIVPENPSAKRGKRKLKRVAHLSDSPNSLNVNRMVYESKDTILNEERSISPASTSVSTSTIKSRER